MSCYVLSLISDAWVHAYINVQHICTPIRRAGYANRAGGKSELCRQKLAQDFSFKIHLFPQTFYKIMLLIYTVAKAAVMQVMQCMTKNFPKNV
jgi:hypothetical protein